MDSSLTYSYAQASQLMAPDAQAGALPADPSHAPPTAPALSTQRQLTSLLRAPGPALFLAQYSETRPAEQGVRFAGSWRAPHVVARALGTLSQVVQARFGFSAADLAAARDPIITVGDARMRFEGFSQCAGVYARVDVLPEGLLGDIAQPGTTNVDFNAPMLAALARLAAPTQATDEGLQVSLGADAFALTHGGAQVVERKVKLPERWLKGLTQVQGFLAGSAPRLSFKGAALLQLRQGMPRADGPLLHLGLRAGRPHWSPAPTPGSVAVGGAHRLQLLTPLLALTRELTVFAHGDGQSSTWALDLGTARFELTLSADAQRGFSGEGVALDALMNQVDADWLDAFDHFAYANQSLTQVAAQLDLALTPAHAAQLGTQLAALGLLGYDLHLQQWFYRQLPFKPERLTRLHPRLRGAQALLDAGLVRIGERQGQRVVATVQGTGVTHTVVIDGDALPPGTASATAPAAPKTSELHARCTCEWHLKHAGARGACKHILAVRQLLQGDVPDAGEIGQA